MMAAAREILKKTALGDVKGFDNGRCEVFLGVPYAKAGRFEYAVMTDHWDGVLDATVMGATCPQNRNIHEHLENPTRRFYKKEYREGAEYAMDEDCLNLNIFAPRDAKDCPVVVFIHGGGFDSGSNQESPFDGSALAERGIVTVFINYRVGVLGDFTHEEIQKRDGRDGNFGLDDQLTAIRFVKAHIRDFGGDPDNVTLFGQSGGGGKVTALLQTPAADGLFHKGLIMSGVLDSNLLPECEGSGKEAVLAIMKELGISSVSELETVPYDRMAQAYNKVRPDLNKRGLNNGGSPHPNEFYAGEPLKNGFRKETSEIPLIVGSVFGEFTGFAPTAYDKNILSLDEQKALLEKTLGPAAGQLIPLFEKAYPERKLIDLIQLDTIFRKPSIEYVRKRAKLNDKTWTYLFNMDSDLNDGTVPWHCSDIPYVFHNCEYVPTQDSDPDRILEEKIFDAFMNFVKTGDPNTDKLPEWPASTPDQEYTMVLDQGPRVKVNFDHQLEEAGGDILAAAAFSALSQNPDSVQH